MTALADARLTVTLRSGETVLAKDTRYGITEKTYANRTQAQREADKHPGAVVIQRGRPFYVRVST